MYKAIIIEDESHAAALLENMLAHIVPTVTIIEKCNDLPSGVRAIRKHNPDVVFLDIELPVYHGTQLLDFFAPEEIQFNIIFTTAFNDYAVQAFEMCALDYLMKPLQESKLQTAISKLSQKPVNLLNMQLPAFKQNMVTGSHKKIVIPVHDGFEVINVADIRYLKAEGSYTNINLGDGPAHLASRNLKHFQQLLADDDRFLRIHRSTVVNILFIKKILKDNGYMAIMQNKTELPVSDERVDLLLSLLQKL